MPDGTIWAHFYRIEEGYLLRFPDLADFVVSSSGLMVEAYPVPGISEQTTNHLYLNQVLPLALSRQSKLVLHASAVEIENSAVAFMGESGWGKSTLAASFCTSGHRLLTDDGLLLEKDSRGYFVTPSHPSIRLWNDSRQALIPKNTPAAPTIDYTPKAQLLAGEEIAFCEKARPIHRLYFLGNDKVENISIKPITGKGVLMGLVQNSFLLDIEEQEMLASHFKQLSILANTPIFYRLNYPRLYEALPEVREAILGNCG